MNHLLSARVDARPTKDVPPEHKHPFQFWFPASGHTETCTADAGGRRYHRKFAISFDDFQMKRFGRDSMKWKPNCQMWSQLRARKILCAESPVTYQVLSGAFEVLLVLVCGAARVTCGDNTLKNNAESKEKIHIYLFNK